MAETAKDSVDNQGRGAKVVRLVPDGRPIDRVLHHPADPSTSAAFHATADGSLAITINSSEGHVHREDGEGPVQRRLARIMMALEARGFFSAGEHQEGVTALFGIPLEDLSSDGARRAATVALTLLAPDLLE